jgi:hypothetical protein
MEWYEEDEGIRKLLVRDERTKSELRPCYDKHYDQRKGWIERT